MSFCFWLKTKSVCYSILHIGNDVVSFLIGPMLLGEPILLKPIKSL